MWLRTVVAAALSLPALSQDLFLASNLPKEKEGNGLQDLWITSDQPTVGSGPFGNIDILPAELPNETLDSQMSRMAMGAYLVSGMWSDDRYKKFGDWNMEVSYAPLDARTGSNSELLGMAIYRRGEECTITFAGTKNPGDIIDDISFFASDELAVCGAPQVHSGFIRNLKEYLLQDVWGTKFLPYLTSKCKSVYATGHSLGAAVAVLFNACSNAMKPGQKLYLEGGNTPSGPVTSKSVSLPATVSKLYTFGCPGVSKAQIVNPLSADGAFAGRRFYIQDELAGDPIPYLAYPFGYVHPKMEVDALKLWRGENTCQNFTAATEEAKTKPDSAWVMSTSAAGIFLHLMYANRVVPVFK